MKPTFKWNGRKLTVLLSEYQWGSGQQPALLCFDNEDEECCEASGIPYGVLTVNLDDPSCERTDPDDLIIQFVDVNNWPGIEKILKDCDWCEKSVMNMRSGFVEYPVYFFDPDIDHV